MSDNGTSETKDDGAVAAPTSFDAPADQKAAFKAALDKKKAAAHERSQHMNGENHVSGDSHAAGAKRVFRRKSG